MSAYCLGRNEPCGGKKGKNTMDVLSRRDASTTMLYRLIYRSPTGSFAIWSMAIRER